MMAFLSIGVDAFSYGMALFVICIGLSVTMGLMRVVNLAHGAFAMVGGYLASYAASGLKLSYWLALPLAVVGTMLLAVPLERFLYRSIYSKPQLSQVLMSIGVTFCIVGIVNFIFGPTLKSIPLPSELLGPVDIVFRTIPAHRLFVIACGLMVALGLWLAVERTLFGIYVRATVDNAAMSRTLGVRTNLVFSVCFAVASGLAALGGVAGAEFLPIEPQYAFRYMVTFLVVVSVGGTGSIAGALLASLLLGFVDTLARYIAPDWGNFSFYSAVIAIVCMFPDGLWARARQ
jgi:branched-chain amino acid transport system permease protein